MLLGLGIVNFAMLGAAVAAMAAGGIGIKCELELEKDDSIKAAGICSSFSEIVLPSDAFKKRAER